MHPVSASLHGANGLMLGMASAKALGLGDPVKLDERCSLEARSPDLRKSHLYLRQGAGRHRLPGKKHYALVDQDPSHL
ncbi:MAG: hypothetical protein JETCAE01_08240 [Anaerolineaceae bacterium]|nr:MAG: hypothetical protein JETCAE01_08240 [Anaerolineaceae bacterium]